MSGGAPLLPAVGKDNGASEPGIGKGRGVPTLVWAWPSSSWHFNPSSSAADPR